MPSIFTLTLNPGLDRTLTVPSLHENTVLRATTSRLDWGGKGFNVSRVLQALGEESMALGFVGGSIGQMLEQGLASLGIATDFVVIEGETRTNTVIEEAHSGRYIKVNEAGPIIGEEALATLHKRIAARVVKGSYWVLSGSLPPGVPLSFYGALTKTLQSKGGIVCLDASGDALRHGLYGSPFLVKPNCDEATEITGIPIINVASAERAAGHFLNQGVTLVALSMGEDGMLLAARDRKIHVLPPKVAIKTVVGVGDALLAGLIYALRHALPLPNVARWGVAAGTAAAMTPGVGVGTLAEVSALVAQMP